MSRFLVVLLALAALSLSGCSQVACSCAAPGMVLDLCEAARAQLVSSEASGACSIRGTEVTILQQEGDCHVVLHYRDGTRSEIHAQITKNRDTDGCCDGYYYPDKDHLFFTVPYPGCTSPQPDWSKDAGTDSPDASCGPTPETGCYTHAQFQDCGCRCNQSHVPVVGGGTYPNSDCTLACPCGFGTSEMDYGCKVDSDCALVRAGCCPCSSGGANIAVLASKQLAWENAMVGACGPSGQGEWGCPTIYVCDGRKAVCEQGRCRAVLQSGADAGR